MTQSLPHAFRCAAEGVAFAFKQRNMRIDSGFAVAAVVLGFALRIDAPSWLAIVICIGAVMLFQKGTFQKGTFLIGAQRAAILSTFEPITSIFVGILFLNETLTPRILLGSAITLVAGVFITLGGKKDEDKEEAAKD